LGREISDIEPDRHKRCEDEKKEPWKMDTVNDSHRLIADC
jgi:hypothetical protein